MSTKQWMACVAITAGSFCMGRVAAADAPASCLQRVVAVQPRFDTSGPAGARLYPAIDRADAFARLGLRAGDIYLPAGPIASPAQALEAALRLGGVESLLIPVLRDGQHVDVSVRVSTVNELFGGCWKSLVPSG